MKKIKEAPVFYLLGLAIAAGGLIVCLMHYVRRIGMDGWLNDSGSLAVIYAFILIYFMRGLKSNDARTDDESRRVP